MSQPKVSLIVPAYNTEAFIEECLDSILAQTFTDFEAIIVDDGSTDSTPKIIKRYLAKDDRLKVVTQKNGGLSNARNSGFREATGDYVMFIDSDDFFDKDMIETMYTSAFEHDTDVTIASFNLYDNNQHAIGDVPEVNADGVPKKEVFSYKDISKDINILTKFAVMVWNKIYKRDFLIKNSLSFNEAIYRSEDMVFNAAMLLAAKRVTYVDKPILYYRVGIKTSNVATTYKYPMELITQTLPIIQKTLEAAGEYAYFEKSYANVVLGSILSTLYYTEEHPIHEEVYKAARALLVKTGIAKKPAGYFFNAGYYAAMQVLVNDSYAAWLRFRIIDLRDDETARYTAYLLGEFKRKFKEEEERYTEVVNSLSWKVTRPLRWVVDIAKRR